MDRVSTCVLHHLSFFDHVRIRPRSRRRCRHNTALWQRMYRAKPVRDDAEYVKRQPGHIWQSLYLRRWRRCLRATALRTTRTIPNAGTHNVFYAATTNASVYAFDADDPSAAVPLWHVRLLSAGERPIKNIDVINGGLCRGEPYADFSGHLSIVGAPVVDVADQTLYVVVRTKQPSGIIEATASWFFARAVATRKIARGMGARSRDLQASRANWYRRHANYQRGEEKYFRDRRQIRKHRGRNSSSVSMHLILSLEPNDRIVQSLSLQKSRERSPAHQIEC